MKVSDFPNEAPTSSTKVPVVGEKHYTIEQLMTLLDQRFVRIQPPQAQAGTGAATRIIAQKGANGDETGGDVIIESGDGGPEHGTVGSVYIRCSNGNGGGGNVVIEAANQFATGRVAIGLRGSPAKIMVLENDTPAIRASDGNVYVLDVVGGVLTATLYP